MHNLSVKQRGARLQWLFFALTACAEGGEGGPERSRQPVKVECQKTMESVVRLDATTSLGFSAEQVLATALGTHQAPIRWDSIHDAAYDAQRDGAQVTFEISRGVGAITEQHYEPTMDGRRNSLKWTPCEDRLSIPVDVDVRTTDGALNEQFRTNLLVLRSRTSTLTHKLDPTAMRGSLRLRMREGAERTVPFILLSTAISENNVSGSLIPHYAYKSAAPDDVVAVEETLAHWGSPL